jgi:hypothetical protein
VGEEQSKAFEALKAHIEKLAIMSNPSEKVELLLYITTSGAAVSAALVEERMIEGELKQIPIYFVSEALNGSKLLYSEMEKNGICSCDGFAEDPILFPKSQDKSPNFVPSLGHV